MVVGVILLAASLLVVGMVFLLLLVFILWYGWNNRNKWKRTQCQVYFDWVEPCRVGEPVSFRISVETKNQNGGAAASELPMTDLVAQALLNNVYVEIRQALAYHSTHPKVEYVKEVNTTTGDVVIKFSVRNAGLYLIKVAYNGSGVVGSPFRKRFVPSFVDATKTVFLRPSPTIVCIAGEETAFEIQPRDKYGNDYVPVPEPVSFAGGDNVAESKFEFLPKFVDESLSNISPTLDITSSVFITNPKGGRVEFLMVFKEPGIYKGQILYDGKPIVNGQFDILTITNREQRDMLEIAHNNSAWIPHQFNLLTIGEESQVKVRKAYFYVSPKLFYVQEYVWKIIPLKIATFRVSPMTKIKMISKQDRSHNAGCDYTFSVCDGIQPKVTVEMPASKARTMLSLYCFFLQKRLGGSENFEGKQRMFYQELRGSMTEIRMSSKQISIHRANLVHSSMSASKYFRKSDWCKNFGIKFESENGYDYGGLRREWLELLCVQFFQNNQFGMFCSMGTSRLVHPNAETSRYPVWNLKHYEFAGKVVGKCLFESACGDTYSQMVNARFSRSFLAQILGLPPNYQHFEQDDPELFLGKIKYILENDVSDMELTFSEEEYTASGKLIKVVDLIPQGAKKAVTFENKEQYLNALANYRLGTKVVKEIEAFKKGLHEIVPEELLANFDENELELLMCGRSEFDIQDLKEHHVKGGWTWGITYNKLFNWFCTAVSNMSDDERARLLQFTTGSSLLPHEGFKSLNPKFKISISNDYSKLPTAHTCFNEICLSDHDTFEQFERALKTAISEGAEGFAFT